MHLFVIPIFDLEKSNKLTENETRILETSSYAAFRDHLNALGVNAFVIGNGQSLPYNLLFNVDVYTIRPSIFVSSDELCKTGDEQKLRFNLSGRSNLVVLDPQLDSVCVGRLGIRYTVEIKPKGFNVREGIREAC